MSGGAVMGAAVVGAGASMAASKSASKSAKGAQQSADRAADLQYELGMEQLEFNKQQYDDWNAIFGDTQKTLASYFNQLNPDIYASLGIQNIEQEYVRSRQQLDSALAQRGISNSGIAAQNFGELEVARMQGRADARMTAADEVNQQRLNFLGVGMGQQANLVSGINQAYGNNLNAAGNQQQIAAANANQYRQQSNAAMQGVGSAIGSGANAYLMYQATQPNTASTAALGVARGRA